MILTLRLYFEQGYIAHPYWAAQQQLIDIQKESGLRRARSEDNRAKALTQYLEKNGMTLRDYEELEKKASRPFVTAADEEQLSMGRHPVGDHDPAEIVIPPHQIDGALANTADKARAATRIADKEQIRSVLKVRPIYTGKTEADGVWEHFVVVTAGTGAKLSNQRGLRRSPYIKDFEGDLIIEFNDTLVAPARVRQFIEFMGREIGVGASRKMRWGRFEVRTPAIMPVAVSPEGEEEAGLTAGRRRARARG